MMQPNTPQNLTPDEAQALLAFNTNLMEGSMPEEETMAEEAPMEQEMAPEEDEEINQPEAPAVDLEALKGEIMAGVQEVVQKEIGGIKKMIEDALNEEDEQEDEA